MKFPLAYIAGQFPLLSETFVYREVRGLRQRGWTIIPVSLNNPPAPSAEIAPLAEGRIMVYGPALFTTLISATLEKILHPIQSIKTMVMSIGDAIDPEEPMSFVARCKLPFQACAAIGLAHQLREKSVRHIHCHFAHASTTVGMYAAAQLKIPFSFTGHANDIFQRRALLKKKLQRAAFVSSISQWHKEFYIGILPDPAGKYEVIRCGVEIKTPEPFSSSDAQLKILTVCRLVEKKGVDTAIRATAELNRRGIRAQLMIAGDGPDKARLGKIAADLKAENFVTWLGAVDNSKVFGLLSEADVFTLPCRPDSNGDRDGIPVVLMEAMAGGTPVIAGDLPAIRELVQERVSGMLVEGEKHALLADKLAMLWGDPELRQRLAEGGKARVQAEFSLDMNLDRLERRLSEAQKV